MRFRALKLTQPLKVALASAAVFVCMAGASLTRYWTEVEYKVFDLMTVVSAPQRSSLPITIIGIDEPSFAQLGQRWPWPRSLYARLIDRLAADGAAVIAFDLIFSEPSAPEEDAALAAAIERAGNVVLAADHAYHETAFFRQWLRVEPLPQFTRVGAASGLATIELDSDMIARQIPQAQDAFWRQAVRALIKSRPGVVAEPSLHPDALVRYLGPPHTFPYLSFYEVLRGDASIPRDFFRDQIVLIGRDVRSSPEAGAAHSDMFVTPFLARTKLLTPGVEIHATLIENAIAGEAIEPATRALAFGVLLISVLLTTPGVVRWHPVWSALQFVTLMAVLAGGGYWLFARGYWLPIAAPVAAVLLQYLCTALMWYLAERNRALQIKSAFSRYVSADVVEQMVAHPELLRLGGVRKEITLLFCDLEGFTTLSEKLAPDAAASIINEFLAEMSRAVLRYDGTVEKFLGDGLMAFWGAPLDDAQHALHACRAALAMQESKQRLQPLFGAAGVLRTNIRVGVHTGMALVGNIGSEERFDYTAMGDTVNLASRLEGVNKFYGTYVMVSGATAAQVSDDIALRPVDRIRVKGKEEAVEVFTPCDDPELIRLTSLALAAYRSRDWDAACRAWQAVRARAPQDTVAGVFLDRISDFRTTPVAVDWDGAVALEKG